MTLWRRVQLRLTAAVLWIAGTVVMEGPVLLRAPEQLAWKWPLGMAVLVLGSWAWVLGDPRPVSQPAASTGGV